MIDSLGSDDGSDSDSCILSRWSHGDCRSGSSDNDSPHEDDATCHRSLSSSEEELEPFRRRPPVRRRRQRFHELYLPFDARPSRSVIRFADGMTLAEVEAYQRKLDEEEERKMKETSTAARDRARRRGFGGGDGGGGFDERDPDANDDTKPSSLFGVLRRKARRVTSRALRRRRRRPARSLSFDHDALIKAAAAASLACHPRSGDDGPRSHSISTVSTADLTRVPTVAFEEAVSVFPIFAVGDYPEDVREGTWSTLEETLVKKRSASFEFRADGWDWRGATEEDGMLIDPGTGRLEHPAHFGCGDDEGDMFRTKSFLDEETISQDPETANSGDEWLKLCHRV